MYLCDVATGNRRSPLENVFPSSAIAYSRKPMEQWRYNEFNVTTFRETNWLIRKSILNRKFVAFKFFKVWKNGKGKIVATIFVIILIIVDKNYILNIWNFMLRILCK